jgi:hypothetical protein
VKQQLDESKADAASMKQQLATAKADVVCLEKQLAEEKADLPRRPSIDQLLAKIELNQAGSIWDYNKRLLHHELRQVGCCTCAFWLVKCGCQRTVYVGQGEVSAVCSRHVQVGCKYSSP